jgi:hypothetical protein
MIELWPLLRCKSCRWAKIAAIRRASSLVSSLAAERPTGFVLEIDAGERLSFEGNRDLVR